MFDADKDLLEIVGPSGTLPVLPNDKLARQLAMLIECRLLGHPLEEVVLKYHYSRQRYFQIQNNFLKDGTSALQPRKTGPKTKHVRSCDVVVQIIRHKFLDPNASPDVIAQKMRQCKIPISKRSVQRTLAEYGLQKKTLCV